MLTPADTDTARAATLAAVVAALTAAEHAAAALATLTAAGHPDALGQVQSLAADLGIFRRAAARVLIPGEYKR